MVGNHQCQQLFVYKNSCLFIDAEGQFLVPIPVEESSSGEEYRTIVASQLRTQRDERHPTYQHHKQIENGKDNCAGFKV